MMVIAMMPVTCDSSFRKVLWGHPRIRGVLCPNRPGLSPGLDGDQPLLSGLM